MSTLAEIEAALPKLSPEELSQIEATLCRLRYHNSDGRFDGRPWPASPQEVAAELAEIDSLPPLLSEVEAKRFDVWLASERERQKALAKSSVQEIRDLFT
jgi:hypothetical protein